jgi:hypothetical protein
MVKIEKVLVLLLMILFIAIVDISYLMAQSGFCNPPPPSGAGNALGNGTGVGVSGVSGLSRTVDEIGSSDPNDITGPVGFGDEKSGSVFYSIHIG